MTLDLSGSSLFGPQPVFDPQMNQMPNLMNTDLKAVMYVFTPFDRQFGDVSIRSFQYHFDNNFQGKVAELSEQVKKNAARAADLMTSFSHQGDLNLSDVYVPSYQPTVNMRTSNLSSMYRFILLLTDSPPGLAGMNTMLSTAKNQLRRIYTGYCTDEPVNPTTFSSHSRTINPNAKLVITHVTKVDSKTTHGRFGMETKLQSQASEEVMHPGVLGMLSAMPSANRELYLMTPSNCVSSIEIGDDGSATIAPRAESHITGRNQTTSVVDLFEQPAHHVNHLVTGTLRYQEDMALRNGTLATARVSNMFSPDDPMADGMARVKYSGYLGLQVSRPRGIFDLDVQKEVPLTDIDAMVNGTLDIQRMAIERPLYYDTRDQNENSQINQYSFLISSVVVPIMNSAGLSSMAFSFEIKNVGAGRPPLVNWRQGGAETAYPMNDTAALHRMIRAVEIELEQGILKTIFDVLGDYQLSVTSETTGMTSVRLDPLSFNQRNELNYEIPSCFGGLISPLIGDAASNAHNTSSIEDMFGHATGHYENNQSSQFYNQRDQDFLQYANGRVYDYDEIEAD